MTLHPAARAGAPAGSAPGSRRARRPVRAAVLLLVAVALALAVVLPGSHWRMDPALLEFIVPWLLDPISGFLPLTLALWLLFTVPSALRCWAGVRRGGSERPGPALRPGPSAPARPDAPTTSPRSAGTAEERLSIPAVAVGDMEAGHRRELAEALGIPWRDELIHDHPGWTLACLEAAQHRAAEQRR